MLFILNWIKTLLRLHRPVPPSPPPLPAASPVIPPISGPTPPPPPEAGVRKRIFHFVRPHVRSDGVAVKAHFRGEREFNWAGYKITITVPGRDHFIVDEFNVGASDEYWLDKNAKYLTMPQVGKKLRGWMDQGVGARR